MSTIKVNNIEEATSGGGKIFLCRSWCNWNGEGTVSIRGDGNVSTVTDMGVGRYRVNYSNSFSSASGYTAVSTAGANISDYAAQSNDHDHNSFQGNKTTSNVPVFSVDHDDGVQDDAFNMDLICVGDE
jgi:hypothetical protein